MGVVRYWPIVALILLFPAVQAGPTAHGANLAIVEIEGEENDVSSCQLLILVRPVFYLAIEDTLGLATLRSQEKLFDVLASSVRPSRADCDVSVERVLVRFDTVQPSMILGAPAFGPGPDWLDAGTRVITTSSPTNHVSVCQHLVLIQPVLIGGPAFGLDVNPSADVMEFIHGGPECMTRVGRIDIEQPAT